MSSSNPSPAIKCQLRGVAPELLRILASTPHRASSFKTLHVLTFVDDEPYRRQIKGMRNLNECRHDLARHVFHGRRGELHRAYHEGMEDQLGAPGLVLNCITLWNTLYLDIALAGLRAQGYSVLDADVPRLSPYVRQHIRVDGHYTFTRPELGGRTTGHYATPTPAKTNTRPIT